MFVAAPSSPERVHALAVPILIALLIWLRRVELAEALSSGSLWGVALLLVGLGLYALASWPFNYGYIRDIAILPVLGGAVVVTCGWRSLKVSLPMLLLVGLAIPLGYRIYARLIIRPETYTINAVAQALGLLPGFETDVRGVDIFFESGRGSGVVALGESNRGAKLLIAFAVVGVFVTFSRIRSVPRLVFVACTAIPVILFCNFFRLFLQAVIQVYIAPDPAACSARYLAAVASLVVAYLLFACISSVRFEVFSEIDEDVRLPEADDA